jgi:hypothetical protein
MNCEGPACGAVDIYWDDIACAYRVNNHSNRRILIALTGSSGTLSVRLEPSTYTLIHIAQFDLPYEASFCD